MKNLFFYALFSFLLLPSLCFGQAFSVDELYRDVIRTDNFGTLPEFVANRQSPELKENIVLEQPQVKPVADNGEVISFISKRKVKADLAKKEQQNWDNLVTAVKTNSLTPLHLEELQKRIAAKDAKAIELFAFMTARGIGVKQDLPTSFVMYKQASNLGVAKAKENAMIIFKAMNTDERAGVTN